MRTDILFINCWHAEFPYIPMGTFGLCDLFERHGISSQIINLSLYPRDVSDSLLMRQMSELQPNYVGLILHWKELLSSTIQTGSLVHERFPDIPIIMGGLTASCYSDELMSHLKFIDYIIKGDSEIPLLHLLGGVKQPESIENMVYRSNGSIMHSPNHFIADDNLLNSISFSRLDFLEDYHLYLKRLDDYLGFPIFVGRGCVFDCEYCGGSRSAFLKHSGRKQFIARDTESIVRDTLVLMEQYGCSHVLLSHLAGFCKPVLRGLLSSHQFQGKLRLNLESWDHPDEELLKLHEEVTMGASGKASLILTLKNDQTDAGYLHESDGTRRNLFSSYPTIGELIDFAPYCHIDIFKGYFTSNHTSLDMLFQDMTDVHYIRKQHAGKDVSVHFLAFSTDPASHLSETRSTTNSSLSLTAINQAILFDRNLSTNIMLHCPKSISPKDQQVFQRVLSFSELLFLNTPFIYWLLTENLGFEKYLCILRYASQNYFYDLENSSYEISPSNTVLALNCLKTSLSGISKRIITEALDLYLKHEVAKRLRRLHRRGANGLPEYLTFNRDRVFVAHHNFDKLFLELANYGSINKSSIDDVASGEDPSLYLLLDNSLLRLPIEELSILRMFNGVLDTSRIMVGLKTIKDAEPEWVKQRVRRLYDQGVLIDM